MYVSTHADLILVSYLFQTHSEDAYFNFSTLDESDLALAALEDVDFVPQETKPPVANGESVKYFLGVTKPTFDDEDPSDHCLKEAYGDGSNFNNSFSEIFFRSINGDKQNPQPSNTPPFNPLLVEDSFNYTGVKDIQFQSIEGESKEISIQAETLIASTPRKNENGNQTEPSVNCNYLKGRLKRRLQTNVGATPVHRKMEDNIRREAIALAQLEASQIRREGSSFDIGPFYGLPLKVQHLLEATRGISKLYGKYPNEHQELVISASH